MSTYIELEIQNLLNEVQDIELVGQQLVSNLESSSEKLTPENINSVSNFLLCARLPEVLVSFVLRFLENESFTIPWPYFLDALAMLSENWDEKINLALVEGIEENKAEAIAARATQIKSISELSEWRRQRKGKIQQEYKNNKSLFLEQLVTLRTQQLFAQEKNLLLRLQKMYPGDLEVQAQAEEHRQRYALEILQRRSPQAKRFNAEDVVVPEPEVEEALKALNLSLKEQAKAHPDMAFDFAIVAFILESYDCALDLLSYCEAETDRLIWFRLEVLLKCRHFLDLLNQLASVEVAYADDPETFFATAYLRAQALWGLGQKHTAIEVMEGLMVSRPHYRSASTLHSLWSGQ